MPIKRQNPLNPRQLTPRSSILRAGGSAPIVYLVHETFEGNQLNVLTDETSIPTSRKFNNDIMWFDMDGVLTNPNGYFTATPGVAVAGNPRGSKRFRFLWKMANFENCANGCIIRLTSYSDDAVVNKFTFEMNLSGNYNWNLSSIKMTPKGPGAVYGDRMALAASADFNHIDFPLHSSINDIDFEVVFDYIGTAITFFIKEIDGAGRYLLAPKTVDQRNGGGPNIFPGPSLNGVYSAMWHIGSAVDSKMYIGDVSVEEL
ncbi:MAG: hypothetical protein DRQ46_00335 [Gammaproteobacteria bacterium]|nr:MAG: hypothetical protein DRQ46_00335 [Gammaproteobacteria bacterium]